MRSELKLAWQETEVSEKFMLLLKYCIFIIPTWMTLPLLPKASELVPCSLLPHWNSMRFFATVSLYE